jgi:hypothetical protein
LQRRKRDEPTEKRRPKSYFCGIYSRDCGNAHHLQPFTVGNNGGKSARCSPLEHDKKIPGNMPGILSIVPAGERY